MSKPRLTSSSQRTRPGRIRPRWLMIVVALAAAIVLSACGRAGPEPTATPTKTPASSEPAVLEVPTATPEPAAQEPAPVAESTAAPAEAEPTAAPAPQPDVATVTGTQLNIRSEPNTNADIVRLINQGEQFDVAALSDDGQWVQLAENGAPLGWVVGEFVSIAPGSGAGAAPDTATDDAEVIAEPVAPTGRGTYAPATMNSPDFGAQAFLWWRDEVADRDMNLMRDGGFNWVKQSFAWETIEGAGKGVYDWSIADRVVAHANERDLKLLARLSSDPELSERFWGGKPPQNGDDFADYAFALANRYNCTPQAVGCIQAFQIWNEPNLAREWGGNPPNPTQYVEFLRKAYAAIKRANPNAIVINAGMAPTGDCCTVAMPDDQFYDGMYQAMGGSSNGYFDMLGVHGAGFAAPPELDPAEAASNPAYGGYRFFAFRHVEDIRAIMERYGDGGKRIVLLEFGWTSDPINPAYKWHGKDAGIDEVVKADYLKRAYQWADANWQPWIALMSLITMPNIDWTADGNPQDEEQFWWAIMEPGFPENFWRPAFIELCIYFNGVEGQRCIYDPN